MSIEISFYVRRRQLCPHVHIYMRWNVIDDNDKKVNILFLLLILTLLFFRRVQMRQRGEQKTVKQSF